MNTEATDALRIVAIPVNGFAVAVQPQPIDQGAIHNLGAGAKYRAARRESLTAFHAGGRET